MCSQKVFRDQFLHSKAQKSEYMYVLIYIYKIVAFEEGYTTKNIAQILMWIFYFNF